MPALHNSFHKKIYCGVLNLTASKKEAKKINKISALPVLKLFSHRHFFMPGATLWKLTDEQSKTKNLHPANCLLEIQFLLLVR